MLSRQVDAGDGVRVTGIIKDNAPLKLMYDPNHPDANREGYVEMPNVNIVTEMVDMITASRAYEANVAAVNAAKSMAAKALDIGR
jgi:flagellar basal-body rod protein FlgC